MTADWGAYFGNAVAGADWDKVLYGASANDLAALRAAVASGGKAPRGLEALVNAVASRTSMRAQVVRALDYVALARATEAFASFDATVPAAAELKRLKALATVGEKAAAKAGDAFLAQRFAFQQVRLAFYARDWQAAITAFDARAAVLAKPSADLAGRARYYAAGALRQQGDLARANLELARVHGTTPALAGVAAQDFQPMEDKDWKATLALAKDVRERTELWRLVGFKLDGIGAAQEIVKLDPTSNLIGLLAVRELSRIEANLSTQMGGPDPATVAAAQKAAATLEQLTTTLAATPGVDRPWLLQLIAGHLAARRGDLKAARTRLATAQALRPTDAKVTSQARASLAMALAQSGPLGGSLGDELARTLTAVGPDFGRLDALTVEIRSHLADVALKAGRPVDAEFLRPDAAATAAQWSDARFLKQMIARANKNATAFDRFVTAPSYTPRRPRARAGAALPARRQVRRRGPAVRQGRGLGHARHRPVHRPHRRLPRLRSRDLRQRAVDPRDDGGADGEAGEAGQRQGPARGRGGARAGQRVLQRHLVRQRPGRARRHPPGDPRHRRGRALVQARLRAGQEPRVQGQGRVLRGQGRAARADRQAVPALRGGRRAAGADHLVPGGQDLRRHPVLPGHPERVRHLRRVGAEVDVATAARPARSARPRCRRCRR
jgi:hypothetical protein